MQIRGAIDNPISASAAVMEDSQENWPVASALLEGRSFSYWKLAIACVVGLLSLGYLAMAINLPIDIHDEGIAVYSAQRVLDGYVPFRDTWTAGYPPGQSYVLAGLFRIFGSSLMVERVFDILVRFALSVVAFLLIRRLLTQFYVALMIWVSIVVMMVLPRFYYGYPIFPAILLMLVSILILAIYVDSGSAYQVVLMGICTGLTTLLRHDFGAYCFLTLSLALALYVWGRESRPNIRFWGKVLRCVKVLLLFAVSFGVLILPAVIYFVAVVPLHDIWFNLIETGRRNITEGRWLPHPDLIPSSVSVLAEWWGFYWPLVVCFLMGGLLISKFWLSIVQSEKLRWPSLALALMGGLLFSQSLSRADLTHALPTMIFAIMLIAIPIARYLSAFSSKRKQLYANVSVLILGICLLLPLLLPLMQYQALALTITLPEFCHSTLPRSGCITIDSDQKQAIEYIDEHTNLNEFIYVGLTRHDLVFINDDVFYFLADRHSATRWHVLAPAFTTTSEIQEEMIQDISGHQVTYVVLWNPSDHIPEPNASSVSSGVTLLDDFIRTHYRSIQAFGRYSIWERN